MALVEIIDSLLRVHSLLLGELDLALVQEAQRSRRLLARLLEPLGANRERRVDQLGWRLGIVRREGHAYEARPQGLDVEALADVVEVPVLVGRAVESFLERSSCDHVGQKAPRLKELFEDLGLLC